MFLKKILCLHTKTHELWLGAFAAYRRRYNHKTSAHSSIEERKLINDESTFYSRFTIYFRSAPVNRWAFIGAPVGDSETEYEPGVTSQFFRPSQNFLSQKIRTSTSILPNIIMTPITRINFRAQWIGYILIANSTERIILYVP